MQENVLPEKGFSIQKLRNLLRFPPSLVPFRELPSVLLVGDLFHPVDGLAVKPFLNSDMGHAGSGSGAVPMLLSRREPDHVAGMDLFDGASFVLRPSAACGDDEGLAERVGVPRGPRTRLEGDAGGGNMRRIRGLKEGVDADAAAKPICGALGGGLGADALDIHGAILVHLGFTSWHQSFSQDGFLAGKSHPTIPISVEAGIANGIAVLGLNSTRRWKSRLDTEVGISPIGNREGTTVIQIYCAID